MYYRGNFLIACLCKIGEYLFLFPGNLASGKKNRSRQRRAGRVIVGTLVLIALVARGREL